MERLPFAFHILIQIPFLFVHYPTTRRFPRILSFTTLLALLVYCHTQYSLQSPGEDYILGCSNGIALLTAAYMTFLSPDFPNGLQSTDPTTKPGSNPSQLPVSQKLSWMVALASNMRRIGFTRRGGAMNDTAVGANVDKRGPGSSSARLRFVISRVILSVLCLAIFQFTLHCRLRNPSFNPALHDEDTAHNGRALDVILWTAGTFSEMTFLQTTAAALAVGVGASQPEEWPPMFGSPIHAYSVRRFWSKTWHQILRVSLEGSGAHVAQDALGLDKGTAAFKTVQLVTAFFLSALVHTGGDYAIHRSFRMSGPTLQFFLLQPAAILIEEIAIHGACYFFSSIPIRIRNPELVWRAAGYLWVVLWFTWCTPPWLDAISAAGGNVRTKPIPLKMLEKLV